MRGRIAVTAGLAMVCLVAACGPAMDMGWVLATNLTPTETPRGKTTTVAFQWMQLDPQYGTAAPVLSFATRSPPGVTLAFAQQALGSDVLVDVTVAEDAPLSSYEVWIDETYPSGHLTMTLFEIRIVE